MANEIIMLLMSFVGLNYGNFDHIVVYDHILNKLHAISSRDYKSNNFDNYITITKTSDLKSLGNIVLVNLEKFASMFPESKIEDYKNSKHTTIASSNIDLYLASYINLYRMYKSLPILVENNYSQTIDTFIDCCMNENTDHPATLSYNSGELHQVFRLKKVNFQLFKKFLIDHEFYREVLDLQNKHRQTESQMRQISREYKQSLKKAEEERKEAEKQAKREAREAEKQAKLAEKAAAKEAAAAVRNSAVKKYEHNNAIERDAA